MVLEDKINYHNGTQLWNPLAVMTGLERHAHWNKSAKNDTGVILHFLIGFKLKFIIGTTIGGKKL